MIQRRGITMTEVLITIFVLAIGLLALLTLFPLAALNMQQAIQDDRVGHAVACASGLADMYADFRPANDTPGAARNPVVPTTLAAQYYRSNGASDTGPSNPIYIDPIGARSGGATANWVGGQSNGIPRLSSPWLNINTSPAVPRLNPTIPLGAQGTSTWSVTGFILLDDIVFDTNGIPVGNPTRGLERLGNYNWAYMLRRPQTSVAGVVDVTVVVYVGRPVYAVSTSVGETVCTASAQGTNSLTLSVPGGSTATLRKGTWLLDISKGNPAVDGPINGYFYRVVNVIAMGGSNYVVELQTNLRSTNVSQVVLMDNVVEVFEKGSGWREPTMRNDE